MRSARSDSLASFGNDVRGLLAEAGAVSPFPSALSSIFSNPTLLCISTFTQRDCIFQSSRECFCVPKNEFDASPHPVVQDKVLMTDTQKYSYYCKNYKNKCNWSKSGMVFSMRFHCLSASQNKVKQDKTYRRGKKKSLHAFFAF